MGALGGQSGGGSPWGLLVCSWDQGWCEPLSHWRSGLLSPVRFPLLGSACTRLEAARWAQGTHHGPGSPAPPPPSSRKTAGGRAASALPTGMHWSSTGVSSKVLVGC